MAGLIGVGTTYLVVGAWKRTTQFLDLPKGSLYSPEAYHWQDPVFYTC